MRPPTRSVDIEPLLGRWLSSGIITTEQAERIRAELTSQTSEASAQPARGTSLVVEAMGYLGGVIVLVALGLVTGELWSDLHTAGRLALTGGVTALLLGVGWAVPRDLGDTGVRLRGVAWFVSSATLSMFLAVMAVDGFGWSAEDAALFASGGTAAVSAVLWFSHRHLLQQAAVLVSLLVAAATATALLPAAGSLPGLAIWAVGAAWSVLAWGGFVPPTRAGIILGAVATVIGAIGVISESWGTVLALLTVLILVLVAVAMRDLILLAVGALGTLIVLPVVVSRYLPGVLSVALVLLLVGALLVVSAVVTARRRRRTQVGPPARDWSVGMPQAAILAASSIIAAATACVLVSTLA